MGFDARAVMVDTSKACVRNDIGKRYSAGTLNDNDRVPVAAPAMQVSGHVDMTALQRKLKRCTLEGPAKIFMAPCSLNNWIRCLSRQAREPLQACLQTWRTCILRYVQQRAQHGMIDRTQRTSPPPPPPHTRLDGAGQFDPNNP